MLPSIQEALGVGVGGSCLQIPALQKWRQEDQECKVIPDYIEFKSNLDYLGF